MKEIYNGDDFDTVREIFLGLSLVELLNLHVIYRIGFRRSIKGMNELYSGVFDDFKK